MGLAGMRPNKQKRNRPQGRASSIQPSFAAVYSFAKARISCWSWAGSMPENIYAALPLARNEIATGLAQADMHSKVSMLKSRISASLEVAKISFNASAKATPFGVSSAFLQQVEQMKTVWCNGWPFQFGVMTIIPLTHTPNPCKITADDSATRFAYNPMNPFDRIP